MFKLHKSDVMDTTPFLYYAGKTGEAFSAGEAVVLDAGVITKCGATVIPDFICIRDVLVADLHDCIPVFAISRGMEFETVPTVAIPTASVGSSVTLDATATSVTATTADGIFQVTHSLNSANTPVLGRFTGK